MTSRKIFFACLGAVVGLAIVAVLAVALFPGWYSYTENRNFQQMREKSKLVCERMPLHCLVEASAFDGIRRYIADGRDLELRDNWGQTALHWAVKKRNRDAVDLLLKAGANPDAKNERGVSVLYGVTLAGSFNFAKLLLAHGANVDLMNDDRYPNTTLHTCVQYSRTECVRFLLENGARRSIKDSFGYTVIDRLGMHENISDETRKLLKR